MRKLGERDATQASLQEPATAVSEETLKPAVTTNIAVDNVGIVGAGRSGGPAVSKALPGVEMETPAVGVNKSASAPLSSPVAVTEPTVTQHPQRPISHVDPTPASRPTTSVSPVSPAPSSVARTQPEIDDVAARQVRPDRGTPALEAAERDRPTTAAAVGRPAEPDSRPNPSQTQRAEIPVTDPPHALVSS